MDLVSNHGIHVLVPMFALILYLPFVNTVGAATIEGADGFSLTMIPTYSRNSPVSPGNLTDKERYVLMLQSSDKYAKRLATIASNYASSKNSDMDIVSPVVSQLLDSHYIVEVSIGTPPSRFSLLLDTGSSFIWVQCKGCQPCFPFKEIPFDYDRSSTFQVIPCGHPNCVPHLCAGDKCIYRTMYGDNSRSNGTRSVETFMVYSHDTRGHVDISNVVFGCGLQNLVAWGKNSGPNNVIAGIFGMGQEWPSFVSQLDAAGQARRFSYCLTHWKAPQGGVGLLKFGSSATIPAGARVYTTPLINGPMGGYYYVNLFHISVDGVNLNLPSDLFQVRSDHTGGMIVDTGAPFTYLYPQAVNVLAERLLEIFEHAGLQQVKAESPLWSDLRFCWKINGGFTFPRIVFHFQGDALFEPEPEAIFVIDYDVFCLQIRPSNSIAMLGAFTMTNFIFQVDITGRSLSFAKQECYRYV